MLLWFSGSYKIRFPLLLNNHFLKIIIFTFTGAVLKTLYLSFTFLILYLSKKYPLSFLGISQALFAFIHLPVNNTLLQDALSITLPSFYRTNEVRGEGYN